MAPTSSNASSKLSMKLLVDTKAGRVLYAEAGKDVVDFLFSLLTMPVGAVVKILSKDAMVGSVGNLYGSVEELDAAYVRSADTKNALLSPAGGHGGGTLLRLPDQAPTAAAAAAPLSNMEVYQCDETESNDCCDYVAVVKDTPCCQCGGAMNVPIKLVGPSRGGSGGDVEETSLSTDPGGMGFVQGVVTYMVMDDLKVKPLSTISGITALNAMGITHISSLKEKTVRVGHNEGLEVLRASLQSKTVLTDVFLGEKSKEATPANAKKLKGAQSQKKKRKA